MQNGENAFGKFFGLLEFKSHAAKTKVKHTCTSRTLVPDDGVGICACHRDALGFALHGINRWSGRRRGLPG